MKGFINEYGIACSPCGTCKHKKKLIVESPCYNCISNEDLALHKPNNEIDFVNYEKAVQKE